MNKADPSNPEPAFRIGAVSRLTGVAPDTLRVWERRYGTVTPFRSETGTRLYSQDDVGRLALIKALVDRGDAISCVANLSKAELEERACGAALPRVANGPERSCRVVVLGASLADRLGQEQPVTDQVEIVGLYKEQDALVAQKLELDPDVVVLEFATIQPEQIREIAAASVSVRCECPHHLVELISSLTAFEAYSEECAVLNVDDAALHAFLHSATAQARGLLETALARVMEADDIAIEEVER